MKIHPVAQLFPMLSDQELHDLAQDIKANGLQQPIVMHGDTLLDGRNRLAACDKAGVKPTFRQHEGDPVRFIISANLRRRHLSESQRALVAARLANLPKGNLSKSANLPISAISQPEAARLLNVSPRSLRTAKQILEEAPHKAKYIEAGTKTVTSVRREIRREEIEKVVPAKPTGKYRVLYADPPWKYGDQLTESYGATRFHYPSMSIADLCALPIRDLAEDNAVLFLWVTSPILPECFDLISAWGFKYKASFVWDKIKHNMGHYNSVRHEFLLICTKGSCLPDTPQLFDSVQTIERTEHSRKPDEFRKIIETLYTRGEKIELFARETSDGWESWGNEL